MINCIIIDDEQPSINVILFNFLRLFLFFTADGAVPLALCGGSPTAALGSHWDENIIFKEPNQATPTHYSFSPSIFLLIYFSILTNFDL
jgi:hypothetical protein